MSKVQLSKVGHPSYYLAGEDDEVRRMMGMYGFVRVDNVGEANLVVFTGGADINPFLYGQLRHRTTQPSMLRDLHDIGVLKQCIPYTQTLVGICRGAQFLNCMVGGGLLWQNVDNHAVGERGHDVIDKDGTVYRVNSYHHQMMIPGPDANVLLRANECSFKETVNYKTERKYDPEWKGWSEPEAIFYPDRGVLCFQPHPECADDKSNDTKKLFFNYIEEYALSKKQSMLCEGYRKSLASSMK